MTPCHQIIITTLSTPRCKRLDAGNVQHKKEIGNFLIIMRILPTYVTILSFRAKTCGICLLLQWLKNYLLMNQNYSHLKMRSTRGQFLWLVFLSNTCMTDPCKIKRVNVQAVWSHMNLAMITHFLIMPTNSSEAVMYGRSFVDLPYQNKNFWTNHKKWVTVIYRWLSKLLGYQNVYIRQQQSA